MTVTRHRSMDFLSATCGRVTVRSSDNGGFCIYGGPFNSLNLNDREHLADLHAAIGELLADLAEKGERTP